MPALRRLHSRRRILREEPRSRRTSGKRDSAGNYHPARFALNCRRTREWGRTRIGYAQIHADSLLQRHRHGRAGVHRRRRRHRRHHHARCGRLRRARQAARRAAQPDDRAILRHRCRARRYAAGAHRPDDAQPGDRLDVLGARAECRRSRRRPAIAGAPARRLADRARPEHGAPRRTARAAPRFRRAARADDRLFRRGAGGRAGALDRDQRAERRQHGLSRLRAGRHRLLPGRRSRARSSISATVTPPRATARSSAPASRPRSRSPSR